MRVLVTGGPGVIGEGLIPAPLEAGHAVRLLSRGAESDAGQWPGGVEPFAADVTDPKSLRGAAAGGGGKKGRAAASPKRSGRGADAGDVIPKAVEAVSTLAASAIKAAASATALTVKAAAAGRGGARKSRKSGR
jgi:uncharacterized protein YbjT (DUF2867 family)